MDVSTLADEVAKRYHVHLVVDMPPTLAPAHIVSQFKGRTSRMLRQEFPRLVSRMPTLWSRSYYMGSAGHVSEATVCRYIEGQKKGRGK